jgi:hypothetical protein
MREQNSLMSRVLGGWQVTGATFIRSGTPLWVTRTDDTAGVGDSFSQPWNLVGDPKSNANGQLSGGVVNGVATDQNFWFNPAAYARPTAGTFGNTPRNNMYGPKSQQWDIALFKNIPVYHGQTVQFRAEMFNFPNHPNLSGPSTDPTNAQFGRITSKDGSRRDVQLSLRYLF